MKWSFSAPLISLLKSHSIGHQRFGETLLRVIRRTMTKRQRAPLLAQAAHRFGPLWQVAAGLPPVTRAGLVGPFGQVRRRLAVRAAGPVGAHRLLVPPDRQRPKREIGVALDRPGQEAIRLANLRDRPVRVENEERKIADGAKSKAGYANQAVTRPRVRTPIGAATY